MDLYTVKVISGVCNKLCLLSVSQVLHAYTLTFCSLLNDYAIIANEKVTADRSGARLRAQKTPSFHHVV